MPVRPSNSSTSPQRCGSCPSLDHVSPSLPTPPDDTPFSPEDGELTPLPKQKSPPVKSWSDVVSSNPNKNLPLKYFPPVQVNGSTIIKPPPDIIQKGINIWSASLVGSFMHSKLPFKLVETAVFKLWGNLGLSKVLLHNDGYFIFKFNSVQEKDDILALGPWHIASKPLFLKSWEEGVNFQNLITNSLPVWAKVSNIPLAYWTAEGLSYIASGLGKPLFADEITSKLDPLPFARICVEMEASSSFPSTLNVSVPSSSSNTEKLISVSIEYQGKPPVCPHCKSFGHTQIQCPKANFMWVPKAAPKVISALSPVDPPPLPSSPTHPPANPVPPSTTTSAPLPTNKPTNKPPDPDPLTLKNSFSPFSVIPDSPDQSDEESPIPHNPILDKLKGIDEKEIKDLKTMQTVGGSSKSSKRKKKASSSNLKPLPI